MKRHHYWNFDTAPSADGLRNRLSTETDIYIIDFDSVFGFVTKPLQNSPIILPNRVLSIIIYVTIVILPVR